MTSIREARPDDAPAIAGLLADIGHPVSPFEVPRRLEAVTEAPGKVFVAENASDVIGVVSVNRTPGDRWSTSPRSIAPWTGSFGPRMSSRCR